MGVECQGSTNDEIIKMCKANGVEFSITTGGSYPKMGGGIPHSFVFDHTGKEIFSGHPSEAEAIVEKALLTAPGLYLGETKFEKLKALAKQCEKKSGLGAAAAALRKKVDSTDEAEKMEAVALLKVLEDYAQRRKEEAMAARDDNPDQYLANMKSLAKEFSGDQVADEAKALTDKDEADADFQKMRKGLKEVAAQEKILEDIQPCKACKGTGMRKGTMTCETCRKANEDTLNKVKKTLADIAKKYEGTAAAQKAQDLAAKL